jgi:hypothetical protein
MMRTNRSGKETATLPQSPWVAARIGAGLLLLVGLIAWNLDRHRLVVGTAAAPAAPPLWASAPPTCELPAERAAHGAERTARAAEAKQQRYPFHPENGVQAVRLYMEAAACFRHVGEDAGAARATASAQRLRETLERRFRRHQLRMGIATDQRRYPDALKEARQLRRLLIEADGDYSRWLDREIRRLTRLSRP